MTQEKLQRTLEALGKGGIIVNGDLVLEKHVENEIGNVRDDELVMWMVAAPSPMEKI